MTLPHFHPVTEHIFTFLLLLIRMTRLLQSGYWDPHFSSSEPDWQNRVGTGFVNRRISFQLSAFVLSFPISSQTIETKKNIVFISNYILKKFAFLGLLRICFHLCNTLSMQWIWNNIYWIQTADLWCRKQLVYQLSQQPLPRQFFKHFWRQLKREMVLQLH